MTKFWKFFSRMNRLLAIRSLVPSARYAGLGPSKMDRVPASSIPKDIKIETGKRFENRQFPGIRGFSGFRRFPLIFWNSMIFGGSAIFYNSTILGNPITLRYSTIFGNSRIFGNSTIFGDSTIFYNLMVFYNSTIFEIPEIADLFPNFETRNITMVPTERGPKRQKVAG